MVITCELRQTPGWFNRDMISGAYKCSDSPTEIRPQSLIGSFVCFLILFHSCCSHAQVFGKTLVHEFPVSYSRTEWYLLFSLCDWQWIIINGALLNKSYYYYYYCSHAALPSIFAVPMRYVIVSGVLSDTYVFDDFVFWLVYLRSSRVCYIWLVVSWLDNLLLFARKASFCLLHGLVVMYSAELILMLIFSLYLTSMNK